MKKIKAILCDLGGIYLQISFDLAIKKWAELSGQTPFSIKNKFYFDKPFADFEVNKTTQDAYISHLRNILSLTNLSDEQIKEGWNDIFIGINMEMYAFFQTLKEKGVRLIGVTNTNPIHEEFWSKKYASEMKIFHSLYSSVTISLRKPEANFFEYILKKESLTKDDVVFFDDLKENYEGGRHFGIRSFLFTSFDKMKDDLKDMV